VLSKKSEKIAGLIAACQGKPQDAHYLGYFECFNRQLFYEAHDVLVAIRDAGIGMAPESLDRLFSPFYTTKPEGLGLGLSICRSIVEAHGGQIWAARNAGPGMTFKFAIPAPVQSD